MIASLRDGLEMFHALPHTHQFISSSVDVGPLFDAAVAALNELYVLKSMYLEAGLRTHEKRVAELCTLLLDGLRREAEERSSLIASGTDTDPNGEVH
jgi:hypothetical protein